MTAPVREPRDFRATDARLRSMGDLTVLVDLDAFTQARAGRGRAYPEGPVLLACVAAALYRLPLRQSEGFLHMVGRLLGLAEVSVPDHTTLCRRRRQLVLPELPRLSGPRVVLVDATGITVRSPGRWIEKYGRDERRRRFVKLHVAIDQATGQVLAHEVTAADGPGTGDVSVGPGLIRDVGTRVDEVAAVVADRAYDATGCYQAARDVGATLLTPPKARARYGGDRDRDVHLAQVGRIGEPEWRLRTGYGARALVESEFARLKRLLGDRVRARSFEGARAEIEVMVWVLGCAPAR